MAPCSGIVSSPTQDTGVASVSAALSSTSVPACVVTVVPCCESFVVEGSSVVVTSSHGGETYSPLGGERRNLCEYLFWNVVVIWGCFVFSNIYISAFGKIGRGAATSVTWSLRDDHHSFSPGMFS